MEGWGPELLLEWWLLFVFKFNSPTSMKAYPINWSQQIIIHYSFELIFIHYYYINILTFDTIVNTRYIFKSSSLLSYIIYMVIKNAQNIKIIKNHVSFFFKFIHLIYTHFLHTHTHTHEHTHIWWIYLLSVCEQEITFDL